VAPPPPDPVLATICPVWRVCEGVVVSAHPTSSSVSKSAGVKRISMAPSSPKSCMPRTWPQLASPLRPQTHTGG
jgi:hypothetical protein